jgi:iron complex outermembrane receptor protein
MTKLQQLILMVSLNVVLVAIPAIGQEIKSSNTQKKVDNLNPASNIKQLLAQSLIVIPQVRLQSTDKGLDIILETNQSDKLQSVVKSEGNNYIVDIPNTQLRLPNGDTFRQEKPTAGINEVIVTNLDANTVRVTVIGETAAPQVELFDGDEGLVFGIVPTVTTTQTPQTQPTPAEPQPSTETQPEQPSTQSEAPIELVVTGEQNRYRVPNTSAGTRTDTLIRDIPQTVQVVPEEVIRDQRVTRLRDALLNVGGVLQDGGFAGTVDQIGIRGFFGGGLFGGSILVDGFKDGRGGIRETANVERIEVLKGPASILYGGVEPGGVINLVTKQPLRDPYYNADFSVGSFSTFRPSIDISGPINSDRTLLYQYSGQN